MMVMRIAGILLTLSLPLAHSSLTSTPEFGSSNGYDSGGSEPVCWESKIGFLSKNATGQITAQNEGNLAQDETMLLSKCYNGTQFTVTPVDVPLDRILFTEKNYTFRLDLKVLFSEIDERIVASKNGFDFHYRLQLCDAVRLGFCNPMRDTHQLDDDLKPVESDLGAPANARFVKGDNMWEYDESTTLRGLSFNDEKVIYSRWIKWTLEPSVTEGNLFEASVDVTLQLDRDARPAPYFFLGHAVLEFQLDEGSVLRVDIADAIPDNVVDVKPPPAILVVGATVKLWVGLSSGIFGLVSLAMLGFTLYHREHEVMKLSQGSFLCALAFAGFWVIGFTFTLVPTRSVFCHLRGPALGIPSTFLGAVLVGRSWRMHATLSGAALLGRGMANKNSFAVILSDGMGFLAHMRLYRRHPNKRVSVCNMRQSVSHGDTWMLIFILTLPQLVFQLIIAIVSAPELTIEYNNAATIGRLVCAEESKWVAVVTSVITAFVFCLAVLVAWVSRHLPAAFNETEQIFHAALLGCVYTAIAITMKAMTDDPGTKPDIFVFVESTQCIALAVSVLILIVWPKIRRVRSGEKVVIGALLGSRLSGLSATNSNDTAPPKTVDELSVSISGKEHEPHSSIEEDDTHRHAIILVDETDPLPSRLEAQVFQMELLLCQIVKKCGDGRPLTVDEWSRLRKQAASFKAELDKIELMSEKHPSCP